MIYIVEEWKVLVDGRIPEEKNRFMISSIGRLMNKDTGYIYKPTLLRTGYYSVRVGFGHSTKMHVILHKAVATTFIENPNQYPEVNHKDGNKKNNTVENLEWCTSSRNKQHAYNSGLFDRTKISGVYNHNAKLTEKDVLYIRNNYTRGSKTNGQRALAKKFNVSKAAISSVLNHTTWKCS